MNTQPHETFSEPETLAPCPQPNFKSLVVFGLRAMASQRITPKMKSQFLRLMGKQIFQILSLCKWQPQMIIILVPLWVNMREYNLGKDQIGPQIDLTKSLIWGWISSKSTFWTKKKWHLPVTHVFRTNRTGILPWRSLSSKPNCCQT